MEHQFFHIITGMSGAGKSLASRVYEDQGFSCVDNLPVLLVQQFIELTLTSHKSLTQVVLVCDIRGGDDFKPLFEALDRLEKSGIRHRILFLEASTEVLIRRFSETRRKHPLRSGALRDSIETERKLLADLRGHADIVIDTSSMTGGALKAEILRILERKFSPEHLNVLLTSFGFKYGIPVEADLVFDVRFLPNPYYIPELSQLTGEGPEIQGYVFGFPQSQEFFRRLTDLLDFLIPQFMQEGKSHLTIAIGCTGGKHRSVAMVERLEGHLSDRRFAVVKSHRDMARG